MQLKLKPGLSDAIIYIPFERRNVMGKFIDERLYPHLYKKFPELFEVVEDKKTKKKNDISIDNTEFFSGGDTQGESNELID